MGITTSRDQNGASSVGRTAVTAVIGDANDAQPSFGTGALEILEVTKVFEIASIPCCILGIAALKYYGAGRLRHDWEICVPTTMVDVATSLLKSEPYKHTYETFRAVSPGLQSLIHTYPRFKLRGVDCFFVIVPSDDYHFECNQSTIERSSKGLPYPKLEPFAQSLLDSHDILALTDLIDGMDLTEEWGQQNLVLSGTQDLDWAKRKNEEIRTLVPDPEESCWYERNEKPFNRKETWDDIVRTKGRRIGVECPREIYATRFRRHNDQDPRITFRDYY